ncbi:hypothetical protein [Pseudodonghicola flavimaris]|uniref:Uncharacterized protein n=1 Tax=Pseudodonghicola flavimaris TaxID=3050036 RepID=A0ABT7F3N6_9RHOB|nr:hypothetical protein [Pseudodonghicola flavimaris]MDK3019100.1 hypothetical protein [Pseudodonghicola flavimaris]
MFRDTTDLRDIRFFRTKATRSAATSGPEAYIFIPGNNHGYRTEARSGGLSESRFKLAMRITRRSSRAPPQDKASIPKNRTPEIDKKFNDRNQSMN